MEGTKHTDIKKQSKFCMELASRLDKAIQNSGDGSWSGMENHERHRADIRRLRRELMDLQNMLNPWWKE